jgi:hypothetical protein
MGRALLGKLVVAVSAESKRLVVVEGVDVVVCLERRGGLVRFLAVETVHLLHLQGDGGSFPGETSIAEGNEFGWQVIFVFE